MDGSDSFRQGFEHQRAGRLVEAERLYRQTLEQNPTHANALFLLAGLEMESGRAADAVDKLTRATALAPNNAVYHANLGEAYRRLERYDLALPALLRAMNLRPDLAEPVFNLGVILDRAGMADGALACFERAASLRPDSVPMRERLAQVRQRAGSQGEREPELTRDSVPTIVALTSALLALGGRDRAIALLRRALEIHPSYPDTHTSLGLAYLQAERADEAIASFRDSLALDPNQAPVLSNLAVALGASGLASETVDASRRALELEPHPNIHSNLLFFMQFDPRATAASIRAEARAFDRAYGSPARGRIEAHRNDPSPGRRLRVGYVSPDFRNHCQALFTVPLLSHHDHDAFEIVCYSSVKTPDDFTSHLTAYADRWHNVAGVDDDEAARRIRADGIDILVDLTMHMQDNRLLLFARKPAPVQVCWLAYPGTTGLSAMDFRLTDPHLDPEGTDVGIYSEKTFRLPETFWCYDPLVREPEVGPLPALAAGHVTFGCLNNFLKVSAASLDLWGRVLGRVPGSRLVVMAPVGQARERVTAALAKHGVESSRIEFAPRRVRAEYLASYGRIDVCLDTVPYGGHTTSLDALWMGVPVVTLVGPTLVGRAGLSQAKNLGLPELVAATEDEYVERAVGLARNLDRLAGLRATLRPRLERSPLMDAPRFARNLEAAYRAMWQGWCGSRK